MTNKRYYPQLQDPGFVRDTIDTPGTELARRLGCAHSTVNPKCPK